MAPSYRAGGRKGGEESWGRAQKLSRARLAAWWMEWGRLRNRTLVPASESGLPGCLLPAQTTAPHPQVRAQEGQKRPRV